MKKRWTPRASEKPDKHLQEPLFAAEMVAAALEKGAEKSDFQKRSRKIGADFEQSCNDILEAAGFRLQGKLPVREAGVEIDQVAKNRKGLLFGSSRKSGPRIAGGKDLGISQS